MLFNILITLTQVGKLRPGVFEAKEGEENKEEKQVFSSRKKLSFIKITLPSAGAEGWEGEKCVHQDRGREGWLVGFKEEGLEKFKTKRGEREGDWRY